MNGYMTSLHPTNNSFQKLYTSHSTCTWGSLSREQLANLDAKATCMICVLLVTSYESTVCCLLRLTLAHDDETSLSLFIHLPCIHSIQTQPILCKALRFISVCIPASDQALLLHGTVLFLHCYCHTHWLLATLATTQTQGWPQISDCVYQTRSCYYTPNLPYMVCILHKIYWTISSLVIVIIVILKQVCIYTLVFGSVVSTHDATGTHFQITINIRALWICPVDFKGWFKYQHFPINFMYKSITIGANISCHATAGWPVVKDIWLFFTFKP